MVRTRGSRGDGDHAISSLPLAGNCLARMQNIKFIFRVRVTPGLVTRSFSRKIEQVISEVAGVENISGNRFTFYVYVQRPQEESAKDISTELKDAFAEIDGVEWVKEVKGWSRY